MDAILTPGLRRKGEYCISSRKWGPQEREIRSKEGTQTLGRERKEKGVQIRKRERVGTTRREGATNYK